MHTEITCQLSPAEEELAKKRDELVLLQNQLAEQELFLANMRAELAAFEGQYLRQVGTLYAELDDWNAKIAETIAEQDGSEEARSGAHRLARRPKNRMLPLTARPPSRKNLSLLRN
jgi:hypothetical protein